jgi:hypothetical protein
MYINMRIYAPVDISSGQYQHTPRIGPACQQGFPYHLHPDDDDDDDVYLRL